MNSKINLGDMVKVTYPDYVANLEGIVTAKEDTTRWIVKLTVNPVEKSRVPFLLSLSESDFEVLESTKLKKFKARLGDLGQMDITWYSQGVE